MKKIYLLLVAVAAIHTSLYAQWTTSGTNIYNSNTGNVGIGTSSPAGKLHLSINSTTGGGLQIDNTVTGTGTKRMYLNSYGSAGAGSYWSGLSSANTSSLYYEGLFVMRATGSLVFSGSSTAEHMRITTGGNVGIGTTNPGSFKLAVEGMIGAREVQVITTTPWPDYVFSKSYRLRPLKEVEQYIHTNAHLPDVPSAKEVQENGLKLGEMEGILLKKIEELTLYMIELKKENEALQQRVWQLENK